MLNGLDPIIIFQFSNLLPSVSAQLAKIPLVSDIPDLVAQPPIPLYLSENLTGLFIDAESKTIDANTQMESKSDGDGLKVNQKAVASIVSVDLIANKNSLGLTLLGAMADLILEKLTSKEYFITYLNGATTIFRGTLHSFGISQERDNDLLRVKVELSRGDAKNLPSETTNRFPNITKSTGNVPLT